MNPLTIDLIATILTSVAALACGGLAVWVLPWSEKDWEPRALPAKQRAELPRGPDPAARAAHASIVR